MRKHRNRSDILTTEEIDALLNPVNDELTELLEKLKKSSHDTQQNELEQLSVETLELLAVKLYKWCSGQDLDVIILKTDLLRAILRKRFRKLNSGFEWTQENKKKFLEVNDKLTQTFEKAYKEALSAAKELENRLNNNDDFIKDYEIEIKLRLHTSDEDGIGLVLSQPIFVSDLIDYHLNSVLLEESLSRQPMEVDRLVNWNIEYFGDTFANDYIGYATHHLLDVSWSFKDIIGINTIYADVEVIHQYREKIKC